MDAGNNIRNETGWAAGRRVALCCALLLLSAPALANGIGRGVKAWKSGDPAAAFEHFAAASTNTAAEAPIVDIATYNAGTAALALGDIEASRSFLESAKQSSDPGLVRDAHHNIGNAWFVQAGADEVSSNLQEAVTSMDQAVQAYRDAVLLDPADRDTKALLELALHNRERLRSLIPEPEANQPEEDGKSDENDNQEDEQQDDQNSDPEDEQEDQTEDQQDRGEEQKPDQGGNEEQEDQKENERSDGEPDAEPGENGQAQSRPEAREMSPEEVRRMLQAIRSEEQEARDNHVLRIGVPLRVEKNW